MDNQHRHIDGYRELDVDDIDMINQIKAHGNRMMEIVAQLEECYTHPQEGRMPTDPRWVAIGKTHIQEGCMALVRSLARPDGV